MRIESGGHGGVIVNIASIVGLDPFFNLPAYTATKHAVVGYTRCLADNIFETKFGIKFITICPGVTDTSFAKSINDNVYRKDLVEATEHLVMEMGVQS